MSAPTQRQRVGDALRKHRRRGVSQLDFDGYPTIDGLPPIRRLASRIDELRQAGWRIDSGTRRNRMSVYISLGEPEPIAEAEPAAAPQEGAQLFEAPAPKPRSAIIGDDV